MSDYTTSIEKQYQTNNTAAEAKQTIEALPENASEQEWADALNDIAKRYSLSSRNFLMIFLQTHAQHKTDSQYFYSFQGHKYKFSLVKDADSAEQLSHEEGMRYVNLFSQISAANHKQTTTVSWESLYLKAMGYKEKLLTLEEAFKIGHGLHFTLEETESFLVRALDNDGLCYNRSQDLIEAFCFLYPPANNICTAQTLKDRYEILSSEIPKIPLEQKPDYYTKQLSSNLKKAVQKWETQSDQDTTEQFLSWAIAQSQHLDVPSQTARTIYQRLAYYAYELTEYVKLKIQQHSIDYTRQKISSDMLPSSPFEHSKQLVLKDSHDIIEQIKNRCFSHPVDMPKHTNYYTLASALFQHANLEYDNLRRKKPEDSWRYLTINPKTGTLQAVSIGKRIPDLLKGDIPIAKADMLFMLWYIYHILWEQINLDSNYEQPVYDRIADFWTLSNEILEYSLLPEFYAPHLLEQAFLKAILCADGFSKASPFEYYEMFCESVLPKPANRIRASKADSKKTKFTRNTSRKQIAEAYKKGLIDFEGLAEPFAAHFFAHIEEKGQYTFTKTGIYYTNTPAVKLKNPNAKPLFTYPDTSTAARFDPTNKNYQSTEAYIERERFIYGLYLYLKDHNDSAKYSFNCRVNCKKNVSIAVSNLKLI